MWFNPLPLTLVETDWTESFRNLPLGVTGMPVAPHPGAFGVERKHHVHEGVDLYCPAGTPVSAVEAGTIVAILPFTGPDALSPPSPWWHPTSCMMVEGESGVVLYGEITPNPALKVGDHVGICGHLGYVAQVLIEDKGRPMSMLHLELHVRGTTTYQEWTEDRPRSLLDPTPYLVQLCPRSRSSTPGSFSD